MSRLGDWWAAVGKTLQDVYAGPYRGTFARARRDEEDLFMMMVLSDALLSLIHI